MKFLVFPHLGREDGVEKIVGKLQPLGLIKVTMKYTKKMSSNFEETKIKTDV